MSWKEQEEYSEWNVKEYEDYLARPKDDFGYNRMWDVAKYNPYAAYMFARRMENGEIDDQACHYLSRSAEYGCSRAFWRLVTNHPGEIGVRNLCVVFDRCVGFREDVYGREQRLVRTAEGLAEDHPVLWTVLAYYSLCRRDLEAFDGYSAKACQICGDSEKAIWYMALSARHDLETPVKEYKSLYELASLLYETGDIRRAYRYITRSVNDAIAANAATNIQSTYTILPVISGSYNREMLRNQRQLGYCLIGVCLLSIALATAIFFTIRGNVKRSQANAKLKEYVNLLNESNNIKESYIGRYLDMCSYYIGGLERYRSQLRRSARTGGFAEVSEKLKSTEFIDRELDNFYAQFDATFLDLFPDFVEQLNALLQPDKQIDCKSKDGILTTELRVVALIRLGVNDSVKIADFLRRSVSTIYNYRVKLRNSALSGREEFENQVMKIGRLI